MPLIIKEDPSEYSLCPEGLHEAVIVDTVALGKIETPWGEKEKVSLVVETLLRDEDDKPYILAKRFNKSLHEKSSLRQALERLRGKKLTLDELQKGIDLEKLIGTPCNVLVNHNETPERTYANIDILMPRKVSGQVTKNPEKISGSYVRVKDRPEYKEPKEYATAVNGSA